MHVVFILVGGIVEVVSHISGLVKDEFFFFKQTILVLSGSCWGKKSWHWIHVLCSTLK